MNPWGVTDRQAEVLDAMLRHGSLKAAANALDIGQGTAGQIVSRAKRAMNVGGEYQHLIQWDRYRRPDAEGTEARVCADIAARQAKGIAKYGTTVEDNPLPLRDWLQHAYEEVLDQAVYLKRAIEELDRCAS